MGLLLLHRLACSKELRQCHDDLKQARATLDRQQGELDEKKEALEALKTASGEKEAELLSEIRRLKQQAQKDKAELEKAKEVESPPSRFCCLVWNTWKDASWFMRLSVSSYLPFLSHRLQERQWWTTVAAWSSRKQTLVSERGSPAWYSSLTQSWTHTHTCTVLYEHKRKGHPRILYFQLTDKE